MAKKLKVAIIGASGIGKHHAKWHTLSGAEIVAFAGSSPESCAQTAQILKGLFDFRGKGYWNLDQLLEQEQLDIIDVCSPYRFHFDHVMKALDSGANIFCEKPLVWDFQKTSSEMLAQAKAMVEKAETKGVLFGVCTQYVVSIPYYLEFYERFRGPLEKVDRFYMEMETKTPMKEYESVWVDLASHPLSLVLRFIPEGQIDKSTLSCHVSRDEVTAEFDFVYTDGCCKVEIATRNWKEGELRRDFSVNGFMIRNEGKPGPNGIYKSFLSYSGVEKMYDDFMHTTIAQFLDSVRERKDGLWSTGREGLRNLELQLEILESKRVE